MVGLIDLDPGDTLLLCSDGLTRHVSDDTLAEILRQPTPAKEVCHQLLEAALDGGGQDNITIVVGRLSAGD